MYTIFIPKYQNEKTEYLITKVINLYMKNSCCNCIISSPGYMSKTLNTISIFVNELGNIMSDNNIPYIGFFNGMNGGSLLSNGYTIRKEHEQQAELSRVLKPLHICCHRIQDHRKMMFFIDYKDSMPSILDIYNYRDFLDNCTVCGILIGSSNQSLRTYFGGLKFAPASKGEADILMYTDDSGNITEKLIKFQSANLYTDYNNHIDMELIDFQSDNMNIRISKSIDRENYNTDRDNMYFKDILNNFLENNLSNDYYNDNFNN